MNNKKYLSIFANEFQNRAIPLIPVDTGATKNTTRFEIKGNDIIFINDPISKKGKKGYAIYPYYNHKSKSRWYEKVNSDKVVSDFLDFVLKDEFEK